MRLSTPRFGCAGALMAVLLCVPFEGHAQRGGIVSARAGSQEFMESGPRFLNGPEASFGGHYLLGTMALGVPSALVSAANLRGGQTGGLWLGLAGIGLGVGHGALFVAGVREEKASSGPTVWWNAVASVYSTVAGVLQIRSTIGEGPKSSSLRATVTPRADGVRLRVTWKR